MPSNYFQSHVLCSEFVQGLTCQHVFFLLAGLQTQISANKPLYLATLKHEGGFGPIRAKQCILFLIPIQFKKGINATN